MVPIVQQHYLTILVPFILFLFFAYKWLHTKSTLRKNLPPSPPKLPILGNLHQIGKYPHRSLHTLSKKYGDLMLFNLGQTPYLVVSSVNSAREILKTHDVIFADRPHFKSTKKLFYDGKDVGTAEYGEYWRQMKSICVLQLLSNKRVASFRSIREEEATLLMESITKSSGLPINLTELLSTYMKDVICRAAFGSKYNGIDQGEIDFNKLRGEFSKLVGAFRIGNFIPWLSWVNQIDGWNARTKRVVRDLDQFLELVLKQHQDSLLRNNYQKDEESKDFVDVLLQIQKEENLGFSIDRDSIKALMLDMFSGGMDTTLALLEWTMAELLRHPNVMKELKNEIREIVGMKPNVKEDDLEKMKYLKAVIKETIRLHPPLAILGRRSRKDVNINGYDIHARTSVLINIWAIQRDPTYWEDPDNFNPKRFLNSSKDLRGQNIELSPFGVGRRMCPGTSFALAINELVLSNLIHKFDWIVSSGIKGETFNLIESGGVMMRKKTPLLAIAKPCTFI